MTITHLLLDIEGTTCPVSFVAEVLFPYASAQMGAYLAAQAHDPEVGQLLQAVGEAWAIDSDPEAQKLRHTWDATVGNGSTEGLAEYLQQLIRRDIKLTALKDLQGRIWRAGYASGEIVAPLFADVPAALERWHQQGYCLGVYSSGSVPAQQMLYGHCQSGDLRGLFSHWFDTRVGAKQEPNSYQAIAIEMQTAPSSVLFISDSLAELEAADQAGMQVLFSDREGNPGRESGRFERISDYGLLDPGHGFQ